MTKSDSLPSAGQIVVVLIVAHAERDEGNQIRIISARELTRRERKASEEGDYG